MENSTQPKMILAPSEGPPAEVVNGEGHAPIVLVCEHASAFIPASLSELGLCNEDRFSHAVWDIGAFSLAKRLSENLDAPLVASRVSRLVYDCNRPPEAADSIAVKSELINVPGNAKLSSEERKGRAQQIYEPFRRLLRERIASCGGVHPALITIHSFAPVYYGKKRNIQLGLLHDTDDRLARAMLDVAPDCTEMKTALNEPYGPDDGVTHTLREHALPEGMLNVMIEIRNDLIGTPGGNERRASEIGEMIRRGLEAFRDLSVAERKERRKG